MYIRNASSLFLCSKKSTKSNLGRKNITCTSKMRLHFFLCSKKSTKSNLPRMNITCTSKKRLHFSSAAKKVQNQIWVGRISHVHQKCVLTLTLCVHQKCVRFFRKRCCARYGRPSAGLRARWPNASWWARRVGTKIF